MQPDARLRLGTRKRRRNIWKKSLNAIDLATAFSQDDDPGRLALLRIASEFEDKAREEFERNGTLAAAVALGIVPKAR